MTKEEAIKWLDSLTVAIGEMRHQDLWVFSQAIEEISQMIADVTEVKHGEWETADEDWNVYECSVCQHEFMLSAGDPKDNSYNFCPNCGADMRGKAEDIEECLRQMDFEAKRLTDAIDEMQAAKGAIDVEECLRQKKERNRYER